MSAPPPSKQEDAPWDEAQCEAALAELERLQDKVAALRLVIPRVITPLEIPCSPAELLLLFKKGIVDGQTNLKDFREQWGRDDLQNILQYAQGSYSTDKDLSEGGKVGQYGWAQKEIVEKSKPRGKKRNHSETDAEPVEALTTEIIAEKLRALRTAHPSINIATKEDHRDIMIRFISGGMRLRFHILIGQDANERDKLDATCVGAAEPCTTITRCIASRPRANDLKYLLDMIGAYKNVDGECTKCGDYYDHLVLFPTAKRSKQVPVAEGSEESTTVWEPFHEGCLD